MTTRKDVPFLMSSTTNDKTEQQPGKVPQAGDTLSFDMEQSRLKPGQMQALVQSAYMLHGH